MSLFFNYNKPGRGISREEAEKRNYFEILFRKLGSIIKSNLLFFGTNIILFAALFIYFLPYFVGTDAELTDALVEHLVSVISGRQIMSPIPFVVLFLFSPTVSGLTYLCRNFSKQEPVFIASDFFAQTKKNLKQSIPAGLIMTAVLYLYLTSLFYYYSHSSVLMMTVMLFFGLILSMMSFYVFPLIVTFDLPLSAIFKNAFLFAFVNLPQNILVLIALAAIHVLLIYNLPLLWLLLMILLLISFSSYTINFIVWNAFSKHMEINKKHEEE